MEMCCHSSSTFYKKKQQKQEGGITGYFWSTYFVACLYLCAIL